MIQHLLLPHHTKPNLARAITRIDYEAESAGHKPKRLSLVIRSSASIHMAVQKRSLHNVSKASQRT